MKRPAKPRADRPLIEELEPRILYSADFAPTAVDGTLEDAPEQRLLGEDGEYDDDDAVTQTQPAEIEPLPMQSDAPATTATADDASAAADFITSPLSFETNAGQFDDAVDFVARGNSQTIYLTGGDAVIDLRNADGSGHVVRLDIVGANGTPAASGQDLLATQSNYLVGTEDQWRSGIENYGSVLYTSVYDGVDLSYHGNSHQLEYDFIVNPGASADSIRLNFEGVLSQTIDADGRLVLTLDETGRTITFDAPVSYQLGADGTREAVASNYVLFEDGTIGFQVGAYDTSRELIIDPTLSWLTYLGSTGAEQGVAVATDSSGNVYVTGNTSGAFPTTVGAYDTGANSGYDAYITKFDSNGNRIFSTYYGGSGNDLSYDITVDSSGQIYIAGSTDSYNLPTLNGYSAFFSGTSDAFIAKFNSSGTSLLYGTYAGSFYDDTFYALTVDSSGRAYATGYTYTGSSSAAWVVGYNTTLSGASSRLFQTTVDGGNAEIGFDIARDSSGNLYVTGTTSSWGIATFGAYDTALSGIYDAFVWRLSSSGTSNYFSYYGGAGDEYGRGIAVDSSGDVYVAGVTTSATGIATSGAYDTTLSSTQDAFVVKLDLSLSGTAQRLWGTYYGSTGLQYARDIAVDSQGDVWLAGYTTGTITTTADAYQSASGGSYDGFIARLSGTGSNLEYGTYVGGTGKEYVGRGYALSSTDTASIANVMGGHGLAFDSSGNLYLVGTSYSTGMATSGAYDTTGDATSADAFIMKLSSAASSMNTVPGAQSIAEDTNLVFSAANGNQISLSDADAGSSTMQITLSVTNGTLTLNGTSGLTFVSGDGTADASMTVLGTLADLNTALNGLTFTPTANYNGSSTLTISTVDSTLVSLNIEATLRGRYTFDNVGALGEDTSPAGAYDATVVGATSVSDATRGTVLSFDGNDYVQVSGHFGNPANVTLAAWVNLTTADTGGSEVISLGNSLILRLDESASGVVASYFTGSGYATVTSNRWLAGTGWHHVAAVFDDTNNVLQLYIDGSLVGSVAASSSLAYTLGANSFLGRHGNGDTTRDFVGRIDEARVYSRALTAAEISTLAHDQSLQETDTVATTITAANDAPTITSNGGGASAAVSVAENTTAVTTVTATDIEVASFTYSIVGGADAARFSINSSTGALSFVTAPDYEAPADAGANNVYNVTVQVSDGSGGTDTQAIAVTVTDISNALIVTTTADTTDSGIVSGNSSHTIEWLNVNRGADSAISLREAIIAANNTAGLDTVSFNIVGAGVQTINISTQLPYITDAIVIDGYTQTGASENTLSVGNDAVLRIQLSGTGAGGSSGYGLHLDSGSGGSTIRGLVINNFQYNGVRISSGSNGNTLAGNWIGVNSAGTAAVGNAADALFVNASNNVIGGATPGARNVISGSASAAGIYVFGGNGNVIQGNYIGTNATGTAALANVRGIYLHQAGNNIVGGSLSGQGNLISGNTGEGIRLRSSLSTGNIIRGNIIGSNASATLAIGNGNGIWVDSAASGNTIGGTGATDGNIISGNTGAGITIYASSGSPPNGIQILGNSIYDNGGLGIDLSALTTGGDGVTANDGGETAGTINLMIDSPVITTANLTGSTLALAGYVGSAPNQSTFANVRVEIFISSNDASGHGEGRTYLGYLTTDANGNFSGSLTVAGVTSASAITATATDTSNNTSEFGANAAVNVPPVNTVPGAQSVNEDQNLSVTGISANDPDGNLASVALSVTQGTLVVTLAGSATITAGSSGSGNLTLSGSAADINATLASLVYRGNSNFNGVDTLTVLSTDSAGLTDSDTVSITVNALNDVPVITSDAGGASASRSIAENTTSITTVTATDVDGGSLSYSIVGGADAASFAIDSATGALSFLSAPDYENPLDAGANNVYDVIVQVSDGSGGTDTQAISVTVSDIVSTLTVTTTADNNDSGIVAGNAAHTIEWLNAHRGADDSISLREAIIASNNTAGLDTIGFNIAGAGVHTISLQSALPVISDAVTIDGYTQAGSSVNTLAYGSNAVLSIEIDGASAGGGVAGLEFSSSGNTVRGLIINSFSSQGIRLGLGSSSSTIAGNFIGTNAAGTAADENSSGAIFMWASTGNTIGGTTPADRNVLVSGGAGAVIHVAGDADNNIIQGNLVGLNAAGNVALGSAWAGIAVDGTVLSVSGTTIGGTTAGSGNWISGNNSSGVLIYGDTSNNSVLGNSIWANTGLGIDLNDDQVTANDGVMTAGQPNLLIDSPVITTSELVGSTLTLAGYVGSAANQATFANVRVEFFVSSVDASGYGEGRIFLGALTTDANGNFTGSLTVSGVSDSDSVTATATDSSGNTSEFGANSDVYVDTNVAPVNTVPGAQTVNEDTSLSLSGISINDADGAVSTVALSVLNGTLSVTLTGTATLSAGASGTGALTLSGSLADINTTLSSLVYRGNSNYNGADTLTVLTTDTGGVTDTDTVSITVNAVNDAPAITSNGGGATASVSIAENSTAVTTVQSSDLDGGAPSYTIVGGADAAGFSVDAVTGALTFNSAPNREAPADADSNNVYEVIVQVADGAGGTDNQTVSVTVTDLDEFDAGALTDAAATANAVNENAANGTAVGVTASSVDADSTNNAISYSLDDSAGGRFAIDSGSGVVTVANGSLLNRETAASHDVVVRATSADGSFSTQSFTIALTDVSEFSASAIVDTNGAADGIIENAANGTAVGITALTSDADATNNLITYSLDDSAGGRFAIDSGTGVVTVANGSLLDRETTTAYAITVRGTSADGSYATRNFTVSLSDADEFDVGAISDGDGAINAVQENAANGTAIGVIASAVDADASTNAITYSLDDSAGGRFAVDATTGVVTVADGSLLDRETAASHDIVVRATSADGSFSVQSFTIAVNDANDLDVSAIGDVDASADAVNENAANGTAVGITAQAADADATNNTVTYSLDDSATGRFAIDATSGVVTVADGSLLDREAAASHDIVVRATSADGSFSTQTFTIAIGDADELNVGAIIDSNAAATLVSENAANGTPVGLTAQATDADATNNAITYSLDDSAGGRFAIDASTGIVTVADGSLLDREAAASHDIVVRAASSDGSFSTQSFSINLGDLDEADVGAIADATGAANAVSENAANGSTVGVAAQAIDADATNSAVTYSLDDSAGGRFAIDTTSGVITVANGLLLDREAAASHDIVVRATSTDGSFVTQTFTISVVDADEVDVGSIADLDVTADSVSENAANGATIGVTVQAADADATNNSITYSLDDSAGGRFTIDTVAGVVTVADASLLNYEAATSHTIVIRATSEDGSFTTRSVDIAVLNTHDTAPVIANQTFAVDENSPAGTVVGSIAAASPEPGSTLSYSILSGNTAGAFALDAATGQITVANAAALDYEASAALDLVIEVRDAGGLASSATITISLLDRAANPLDSVVSTLEDSVHIFAPGDFAFSNPDGEPLPSSIQIQTTPDAGNLTLNGVVVSAGQRVSMAQLAAGELRFTPSPDANGSPYASFTFGVDGDVTGVIATARMTLDVTPVNDSPVIIDGMLTLRAGETVMLDPSNFLLADPDNAASDFLFAVSNVRNGHFELVTDPGVPVTIFSFAELSSSQVRFVHQRGAGAPTYDIEVSDGSLSSEPLAARVSFAPLDAVPDSVRPDPIVELADNRQNPAPSLPTPSPDEVSTEPTVPTAIVTISVPDRISTVQPALPNPQSYDAAYHRLASSEFVGAPIGRRLYLEIAQAESPQKYLLRVLKISEVSSLDDSAEPVRFNHSNPASFAPPDWNNSPSNEALIDVVKLSGMAVSIGAVVWALRSVGLFASLVASIPLWMRFDPLPVLVFEDDDDDKQEGPGWGLRSDADSAREEQAARDLFRSARSTSRSVAP